MKLRSMIKIMICLGLHKSLLKCKLKCMVRVVMVTETVEMKIIGYFCEMLQN